MPRIDAFSNFSGVVWKENVLYVFGVKTAFSSFSGVEQMGPNIDQSRDCPSQIMGNQIKLLTSPLRIMNISCPMSPLRTMYSFERTYAGVTLVHNRRIKGRFVCSNSGTF